MRLSSGSGFIVTHSGVIVTNAHVVTTAGSVTGRPQLRVQLHDGGTYEAAVRDVDMKADIATIKVNPRVRERTHTTNVMFVKCFQVQKVFHAVTQEFTSLTHVCTEH